MELRTLTFPSLITTAETDMEGRLRPAAWVNLLVQAAIRSAESLGIGFDVLREQNLFWVLHRLTVEVERVPSWNETITTETWPKDINGLLYLRDFLLRDAAGHILARATSGWLAIDRESKRPGQVASTHPGLFTGLRNRHALSTLPEKLKPVPEGMVAEIRPAWSDFDINRHVTSTRYIDWTTDVLPFEFLRTHLMHRLSVNFLKEVVPGNTLTLTCLKEGNNYHFEGIKTPVGEPAYRVALEFRPIR